MTDCGGEEKSPESRGKVGESIGKQDPADEETKEALETLKAFKAVYYA